MRKLCCGQFLLSIIRDGASQTEDAKVAFESLIALAVAEGSVARNLQLALVVCAYPSLIEPRHLKSLSMLTEGVSAGEDAPSARAAAFSAALDTAIQAAAYAKSLRPLELFGESTCHDSVERVVQVRFIVPIQHSLRHT